MSIEWNNADSLDQIGKIIADLGLLATIILGIIMVIIAINFVCIGNVDADGKYLKVSGKVIEINHDNVIFNLSIRYRA